MSHSGTDIKAVLFIVEVFIVFSPFLVGICLKNWFRERKHNNNCANTIVKIQRKIFEWLGRVHSLRQTVGLRKKLKG